MFRPVLQSIAFAGLFLGVMSLVSLTQMTLDFGLSAPIAVLLNYYNNLINTMFLWAEPIASYTLLWIERLVGLDFSLDPVWKHVLVLQWLYFGADARANFELRRNGFAFFTMLWGAFVGFIASVATGTTALGETKLNLVAVSIPVIAIVIFELGRTTVSAIFKLPSPGRVNDGLTRAEIFAYLFWRFPVAIAMLGLLVVLFGLLVPWESSFAKSTNQNLLTLAIFVISLTGLFVIRGLFDVSGRRWTGMTILQRFSQSTSVRIGLLMAATVAGALFIVLTNAGLVKLGL